MMKKILGSVMSRLFHNPHSLKKKKKDNVTGGWVGEGVMDYGVKTKKYNMTDDLSIEGY